MKSFYISLAIIIFLLIGWFYISNFLNTTVLELNKQIKAFQTSLGNKDWEEARIIFNTIALKWNSFKKTLMITANHDEIEKIDLSLAKINDHINAKELSSVVNETSWLQHFINNLKEKEKLSLDNIF